MAYKMSEGPNKNCKFYENYENCKNSQDLRGTQRELQKLIIFAKVPRMAYKMSEGPNENCRFYEITRITSTVKICKISEGPNENYKN